MANVVDKSLVEYLLPPAKLTTADLQRHLLAHGEDALLQLISVIFVELKRKRECNYHIPF